MKKLLGWFIWKHIDFHLKSLIFYCVFDDGVVDFSSGMARMAFIDLQKAM